MTRKQFRERLVELLDVFHHDNPNTSCVEIHTYRYDYIKNNHKCKEIALETKFVTLNRDETFREKFGVRDDV
jgi:hypothetical protein